MRLQVRFLNQRPFLPGHRVGLSSPLHRLTAFDIDDRHKLRVRTACLPVHLPLAAPVREIDPKRQEFCPSARRIEHVRRQYLLDRFPGMPDKRCLTGVLRALVHGDASSTATNPCGKWMTWRCCNQSHNSHTTESCSTGKNQTGFKPIQTDLIPCSRFMSRFRRKTCKPFFHASAKRPMRTRDTRN